MTDTALYEKASSGGGSGKVAEAYRAKWKSGFVPDRLMAGAVPTEAVARVIVRAALAARPRARYVVGRHNRLIARLVPSLPTAAADGAKRRIVGLE
jgi:hypothetical protein